MNKHQDIKNYLDELYPDSDSYTEKLYRLYYNISERPKCKCGCGNFTTFYRFSKGYREFYSCKCVQNYKETKEKIINTKKLLNNKIIQEKYKQTCLKKYGVEHPLKSKVIQDKIEQNNQEKYGYSYTISSKEVREKSKQTILNRYGVDNAAKSEICKKKVKQTCLEKFGVDNYAKTKESKEKYKQTCLKKYGVENLSKLPEIINKITQIKLRNKSFNKSKGEEEIFKLLTKKFNTVIRQYSSDLYPFNCDFYIPEINLYIECNFHWTHGKHKFNENDPDDIKKLNSWKEKSLTSNFYKNAIYIWTISDLNKIKTAEENNLNYLYFYNVNDAKTYIEKYL